MAKTNFSDGSYLTSTFANLIMAHVHDGVDSDGHVAKVNLTNAAEVGGTLPLANMSKVPLTSAGVTGYLTTANVTGMDFVDRSSAQGITGLKTFNSGITTAGAVGITISRTSPASSYVWRPVAVVTGSLPANSYLYGYYNGTGSDVSGGGEYVYVGQMESSTTQSGGIPNTAFVWPASTASMTWDITAYDSASNTWAMRFTHVALASGWGGVVNYQAVVQPSVTQYQTGLSNNYLAIGSDTSNLWFWYKTSGAGDRTVKFTMRVRVTGQDFS